MCADDLQKQICNIQHAFFYELLLHNTQYTEKTLNEIENTFNAMGPSQGKRVCKRGSDNVYLKS